MQAEFKYIAIDTLTDMAKDQDTQPETKEKMTLGDMLYSILRESNSGIEIDIKQLRKLRDISDKEYYEIFEKARKNEQGE